MKNKKGSGNGNGIVFVIILLAIAGWYFFIYKADKTTNPTNLIKPENKFLDKETIILKDELNKMGFLCQSAFVYYGESTKDNMILCSLTQPKSGTFILLKTASFQMPYSSSEDYHRQIIYTASANDDSIREYIYDVDKEMVIAVLTGSDSTFMKYLLDIL